MNSKLVQKCLGGLAQAGSEDRKVTTTVGGDALRLVTKWRGEPTIKDTVAAMFAIANACLEKSRRIRTETKADEHVDYESRPCDAVGAAWCCSVKRASTRNAG